MLRWDNALELDAARVVTGGSPALLREQIGRGADLRIYTSFRHSEHLDTASTNREIVDEVSEFRTTYLIEGRWAAGIMTTRLPINPPVGFGPEPSFSFFLYNEDGSQAIARPYLDGRLAPAAPAEYPPRIYTKMPKYIETSRWDDSTNAPSSNFCYAFERFRFFTNDSWEEIFAHDAEGHPVRGSLDALAEAFNQGCEMKVGLAGLCANLSDGTPAHEVFVSCGPGYFHTESRIFTAGTHPLVRVAPAIPITYRSRNWDFGPLFLRTDGFVQYWCCDPYTLNFEKYDLRLAVRWFIR